MSKRNQSLDPAVIPQQMAFGQSSRGQFSPHEAAAEHWHEVYRLTRELRQRPKGRGTQVWARERIRPERKQQQKHSRAQQKHSRAQQNKQQELLPQHLELPELEFTKPQRKDLAAIRERATMPYRLTDLKLGEPARNQNRFDEADNESDCRQAGRAICRHLIAALRIQHAEEQRQQN